MIGGRTAIDILNDVADEGRRDHRHRLVRVVGRRAVGRSEPDRRDRRADDPEGQDRSSPFPAARPNPYNFLGTVAPVRDASARCRSSTSRAGRSSPTAAPSTSTARAARTSTPAASPTVRRRGPPQGLLPLQARMQGPDDARQLLASCLRRGRRTLADRHRPPVRRLHRAGDRLQRPDAHQTVPIDRPTPPDTYARIHAEQGRLSPIATGVAGGVRRRARRRGLRRVEEARRPTAENEGRSGRSEPRCPSLDERLLQEPRSRPARPPRSIAARRRRASAADRPRRRRAALRRDAVHRLQGVRGGVPATRTGCRRTPPQSTAASTTRRST